MSLRRFMLAVVAAAALTSCSSDPGTETASGATTQAPSPGTEMAETITFTTNDGPIVIKTDPDAPQTVASMTSLANSGYFDNTICHRLVTAGIYVLQCGDPTGTGSGDPGYTVPDENLPGPPPDNYPAATVAMANRGPGTSGSQFFIVYKDSSLPPDYTIWGEVTDGIEVVETIAKRGTDSGLSDGAPAQPVTIESATAS